VDFGLYDNDGPDNMPNSGDDDGFVDLVAILHAEDGGECGTFNIWAHRWVYSGWWGLGNVYTTNDPRTGGGNIQIDDYTIQGAQGCGGGTPLEIGTFAHETGHIFGLPDLYDTQGSSPSQGLGDISLMASGSWNTQSSPAHMSAWEKAELGWITPTLLTNPVATAINIDQVETIPEAYQIVVGNGEYFLIENRQTVGFDINLKTCGLAIYHVDQATAVSQLSYNQVNRYQNCGVFVEQAQAHYGVALEQADGLCQLEANVNRGDSGDLFPGSTNNTSFDSSTNPNSDAYSFATTVAVNGISACGATMTANVSALPVLPDPGVGVDVVFLIDNSGSYFNDYPNINAQMPDIVTALGASFSDIRFGLAIFRDFPFAPFGQPGDEAYELRQSLTGNATTFLTAMNDLTINKPPSGGGDFPEAQYEAFYQTLTGLGRDLDGNTISGDSSGEISPSNMGWGIGRHRIVYLLTDADFHDSDTESYPGTPLEAIGRNAVRNLITTTYPPNVLTLFVMVAENSGAYINQGQRGDVFNDPPTALFEQSNELTVLTGGGVMGVGNDSSGLEDMVGISIIVLENSDINSGRAVPVLGPVALGLMIGGIGGLGAAIARARRRQA
jgi:M6 family metalloprotease-like protein